MFVLFKYLIELSPYSRPKADNDTSANVRKTKD
jgi:hypothetical protein